MKQIRTVLCLVLCLALPFTGLFSGAAANAIQEEGATADITQPASFTPGDVNSDGKINSSDARQVLRYSAQLSVDEHFCLPAGDTNSDGKVNSADARNILRYVAKLTLDLQGTPRPTQPTTTAAPTTTQKDPSSYKIAMIGDSLVATLAGYEVNSNRIDYYGKVNLNVYTVFQKKISGSSRYVIDEISARGYDKVIIHLGINEVSYDNSIWGAQYGKVIDAVKQRAPGAEIYCDAILPISAAASAKNQFGCNNAAILRKNEIIRQTAQQKGVHFVDAGVLLRNADGVLPAGAASDGIHLNYAYCETWTNWLLKEICK